MKLKSFLLSTLFSVSVFHAQIPAYVPTVGLQGFWPFTGNAQDVSGNSNHGTVTGPASTADRFNAQGRAYSFNGSSDYISTNMTGILGNNPRAVSFWAKTTESVATMAAVQWGDEQSNPNYGVRFECAFNEGASGPGIIGADCALTYTSSSNPHNNVWHHYVFQYASGDFTQVEIYQDGALLTQTGYTHNPNAPVNTSSNWPVTFGKLPYMIPHYFKGSLDEIGIWDRVLTSCEIHELFASAKTSVSVTPSNATICPGQTLALTAAGNVTSFSWNTGQNVAQIYVSPVSTQQYTVTGTHASTGCEASKVVSVVVVPCTGLEEIGDGRALIYPNPSTGQLTIEVSLPSEITITNALGQIVKETKVLPGKNNIELPELAEGIYTINGKSQTGSWQKKVVFTK